MKIILASASPRRRELMEYVAPGFETVPADIDETLPEGVPPEAAAEYLAAKKAEHIAALRPGCTVIGSDTAVIAEGKLLGKPKDEADAAKMLRLLSGRTHTVVTGVCMINGSSRRSFSEKTAVSFYPLTEEEILGYTAGGEPMDKAGAYGIQGAGRLFVKSIEGDFYNVVGLPAARLRRELADFLRQVSPA